MLGPLFRPIIMPNYVVIINVSDPNYVVIIYVLDPNYVVIINV